MKWVFFYSKKKPLSVLIELQSIGFIQFSIYTPKSSILDVKQHAIIDISVQNLVQGPRVQTFSLALNTIAAISI